MYYINIRISQRGIIMKGIELKAIRSANRISQKALAQFLNVSQSTISNLEDSDYIPNNIKLLIGNLIHLDFSNDTVIQKVLESIPPNYFKERKKYIGWDFKKVPSLF